MKDFSDMVLTFTNEEMVEHDKQIKTEAIDEFVEFYLKDDCAQRNCDFGVVCIKCIANVYKEQSNDN